MFWGELAEVLDGVVPVIEAADQTLLDTARKIETARRRLDAAQALVVGELDVRGTTDIADGLATGSSYPRPLRRCRRGRSGSNTPRS